jgi:hypothetical protein
MDVWFLGLCNCAHSDAYLNKPRNQRRLTLALDEGEQFIVILDIWRTSSVDPRVFLGDAEGHIFATQTGKWILDMQALPRHFNVRVLPLLLQRNRTVKFRYHDSEYRTLGSKSTQRKRKYAQTGSISGRVHSLEANNYAFIFRVLILQLNELPTFT